mmetsp:Transcript_28103/g.74183  ORF Transcript_28103/g.74183 Transcript_28103/m.74183 type:complete len:403 (-) Transcript_28103:588-1796(-)
MRNHACKALVRAFPAFTRSAHHANVNFLQRRSISRIPSHIEDDPLETEAYVVPKAGQDLVLQKITLPPLTSSQVELDMELCGLCHTDIHMKNNDWGISNFPLVPGHEGVGVVRKVGSDVRALKIGDRVGVSWIRDSCRTCPACRVGRENLCRQGYQGTFLASNAGMWGKEAFNEHGGCFSKVMRVEEKWAIKIPDQLPSASAAPLMCGGGTVFEPIADYVKVGSKVGIIGIGGLGTCAVKLARLCGASVTAFSHSPDKEPAVRKAGARGFVNLNKKEEVIQAAGSMDLLIDTTPVNQPVAPYLDLLRLDGVYCRVGIPATGDQSINYSWIPLIFTQKKIVGSIVSGSQRMATMLQLAADNSEFMVEDDEEWSVQEVPFSQVNDAMKKLLSQGNAGWRYVLRW